jgi:hypothetical protein
MNDCKNEAPYCTPRPGSGISSDCGFKIGATIYFVSYLLIAAHLVMALFISAISEFVSYNLLVRAAAVLSITDLHLFRVSFDELRCATCMDTTCP